MAHAALLRTALLAAIASPIGCGGSTASNVGSAGPSEGAGGAAGPQGAGGGASGQGAGGAAGGAAGASSTRFPCLDPKPRLATDGHDTGYDYCANGLVRRRAAIACSSELPRTATCMNPPPGGPGGAPTCSTDADCTASPYGYCESKTMCAGPCFQLACGCSYGCTNDAECGSSAICECGSFVGTCSETQCHTDADCNEGACLAWVDGPQGCGTSGFACQLASDECAVDADCPPNTTGFAPRCLYEMGHRTCVTKQDFGCPQGRPMIVAGAPVVAVLVRNAPWATV